MKKNAADPTLITLAVAAIIAVTLVVNAYLMRPVGAPDGVACSKQGENHFVVISDEIVSAAHTDSKLCDTLTILNKDDQTRLIAFTLAGNATAYDGITQQTLAEGQSFTIILNKLGTYRFYDRADHAVAGTFTVGKN